MTPSKLVPPRNLVPHTPCKDRTYNRSTSLWNPGSQLMVICKIPDRLFIAAYYPPDLLNLRNCAHPALKRQRSRLIHSLCKPLNRCKTHSFFPPIYDLASCSCCLPTFKIRNALYFQKQSANKRTGFINHCWSGRFWLQQFLWIILLMLTTCYRTHLLHLCLLWQAALHSKGVK